MAEIVVRPYEPKDQAQTWHVRAMTYNSGQPIPVEEQVYRTATPFVGEVDGEVVGTFVIMEMSVTRGDQAAWKCGGVAGVAVLPEARQTGVGAAMMRWALTHMSENGYILASLYAFRESYYRKFGYEVCGVRQEITCPNSSLPKRKPELPIWRVPVEEAQAIRACYESFAKARSGMNLRNDMHWGRILNENKTIYAAGDPVQAYAILEHDWEFWKDQPISEFAWSSAVGYESMLSFFSSLCINKTAARWYEPSDGPFLAGYVDHGISFEVKKPIMYRVLNVPEALKSLRSKRKGSFSFSVHDGDVEANSGPWAVRFGEGCTRVTKTDRSDFEISPQRLVQALLGEPSFDSFVRQGLLPESPASDLLPPLPTYCIDYF